MEANIREAMKRGTLGDLYSDIYYSHGAGAKESWSREGALLHFVEKLIFLRDTERLTYEDIVKNSLSYQSLHEDDRKFVDSYLERASYTPSGKLRDNVETELEAATIARVYQLDKNKEPFGFGAAIDMGRSPEKELKNSTVWLVTIRIASNKEFLVYHNKDNIWKDLESRFPFYKFNPNNTFFNINTKKRVISINVKAVIERG